MIWIFFFALFLISLIGSFIPHFFKRINLIKLTLLLAFSGSFLFGITIIHLMPEAFHELDHKAGILIMVGFLLQLILQKFSHGAEHGHIHNDNENHQHAVLPIFLGLSIHAFIEGIPLGFNFQQVATMPSLFLGVSAHKLPEALTLGILLFDSKYTKNKTFLLILFALMSPVAGMLAMYYGQKFYIVSHLLTAAVPIVIGSFLHIATTILYESGTKHHELSRQKVLMVLLGIGFAVLTLLFH